MVTTPNFNFNNSGSNSNGNVGVRSWLNQQGFNNQQIGYDPTQHNVTLNGNYFTHAIPNDQGHTYGNVNDLRSALGGYRSQQMQNNMYNTMGQINNRLSQQPTQFQAPQPFSYNPATDPQYQQAMNQAHIQAGIAGSNAMVDAARRGLSNSSIAQNDANRVGQQIVGQESAQMLPQLVQQAYQQYQGNANNQYRNQMANYQTGQDQLKNLQQALGTENQMGQQRFGNALGVANAFGTVGQAQSNILGLPAGTETRQLQALQNQIHYQDANLGLRAQSNQIANGRLGAYLSGQNARNTYYKARGSEANAVAKKDTAPSKNEVTANIVQNADQMSPDQQKLFFEGEKTKIIKQIGLSGYNQLYNHYFPTNSSTSSSASQANALMRKAMNQP